MYTQHFLEEVDILGNKIKINLPNRTHPSDPQNQPARISRGDNTSPPPLPLPSVPLRPRGILQHRQDEEDGHVGRRLGHRIARVAEPDPVAGHPVDVELVVPGRGGRDDLATGHKGAEELLVERLVGQGAHAHEDRVPGPFAVGDLGCDFGDEALAVGGFEDLFGLFTIRISMEVPFFLSCSVSVGMHG